MAFIIPEMVQELTVEAAEGTTSPYALNGAQAGYRAFLDELSDADTTLYCAFDSGSPPNYEIRIGTWSSGPNSLSRGTLINSSTGFAIDWGLSIKNIVAGIPGIMLQGIFDPAATGVVKSISGVLGVIPATAAGEAILNAATYAAMRTLLDLEAGIDFNAYSTALNTIAGLAKTDRYAIIANGTVWQSRAITVADLPGGHGSGLDADTVDGAHKTSFVSYDVSTPLFFESSELAYPTGSPYTVSAAHGLSAIPRLYSVSLRCKTTEGSWAVNDEMLLSHHYPHFGYGRAIWANATNVGVVSGSNDLGAMVTKTGTSTFGITPAYWKIILRAWA